MTDHLIRAPLLPALLLAIPVQADVVGSKVPTCGEDPAYVNRIHAGIPMAASADTGEKITFIARDAADIDLDPVRDANLGTNPVASFGVVHPLTGAVSIKGAKAGDMIAVTIEDIVPGSVGW